MPRFSSVLAHRLNKDEKKKESEAIALNYKEVASSYTTNFKPLAEAFILSFQSRGKSWALGENHGSKVLTFLPDPYLAVNLGPQKLMPLFETFCRWENEPARLPQVELTRRMDRVKKELQELTGSDATWRQSSEEERFAFF
jgi:hypothetical protein